MRGRAIVYYGALALVAMLVLAWLPPLREFPLRVPVTHKLDGLFLTILAKAVSEDGLFHANAIGAPFGTDLVDWPLGMWLPLAQMAGLTALVGEPGTAINLHWLSTIVLAAVSAGYAFRRLRLGRGLAFVLGLLYAFQPYAFYRNVEHVNLAFPFVPLLALAALRVALARPEQEDRSERLITAAACVAQGLSYIYYSAFACLLLAVAAPIGWLRSRARWPLRRAALAIALLVATSAITVAPTIVHWRRHGYNPDLDYKPAREVETFALRLRQLLTPIGDHPLRPWREAARTLEAARFETDNESALSRLGTAGGLGLLGLLGFLLARAAGLLPRRDDALDGASALTLATLVWASAGGLATFFNVFVISDIRAYNRMVVFLSFFCLLAFGHLLARAAGRLPFARGGPLAWLALALLLAGGLADQIPVGHLMRLRTGTAAAFAEERSFVREIESRLPAGAMVFQLPHMTVPVDRETHEPMLYYDPGRAYLHSRALRWSWGAMIGRQRDWGRAVDALPLAERARVLALTGFSGIWIDRWGYTGKPRPPHAAVEAELSATVAQPFVESAGGRYSFVSLLPYRERLLAELGAELAAHERADLLADMPILKWGQGCGEERSTPDGFWRACGPRASIELRNWRPGAIRVTLAARLRASAPRARLRVRGPGFEDTVALGPEPVAFERVFEAPGRQTSTIELVASAAAEPAGPTDGRGFEVAGLRARTLRMIRGVPVNEDGGVSGRRRY